jgi:hypothetical protein
MRAASEMQAKVEGFCRGDASAEGQLQEMFELESERQREALRWDQDQRGGGMPLADNVALNFLCSARFEVRREEAIQQLFHDSAPQSEIAATDQRLRNEEATALAELEPELLAQKPETIAKLRAQFEEICRILNGHRQLGAH